MIGGIYRIVNKINGKLYLGGTLNFKSREYVHLHELRKGIHHSKHLQRAYNKYGENAFVFEILESFEDPTKEELELWESWYLKNTYCCDHKYGYNINKDVTGRVMSDETKKKLSVAHTGKILSKSHCQNISKALIGNKFAKGSTGWVGKKHTEKTKLKQSIVKSGENNPFYGRKHSPETIKKMQESQRKLHKKDINYVRP